MLVNVVSGANRPWPENMEELTNCTGNWEIYRQIVGDSALIHRLPKWGDRLRIDGFLKGYQLAQTLNLPTLQSLSLDTLNGRPALVTQDLNFGQSRLYVSPNSVYSEQHRQVELLTGLILYKESVDKFMSPYEQYRYQHKLSQIRDLSQFVAQMKKKLEEVSLRGVFIGFDAYFFGSDKGEVSSIDYKLMDLDDVTQEETNSNLDEINWREFTIALNGFVRKFVIPEKQQEYLAEF
ncbi:MAG: hypothetical protein DI535_03825 [Citrobacter freundii]|nr:MAG: hypothetical protein DI535_03825 [Citrobacter freundii]